MQECNAGDIAHHPEVTNAIDRASNHYQKLLMRDGHLIEMTADNLHLEYEVVKLSKLLEYQNSQKQKLVLIKALLQQQSEKPELNWSSQKMPFMSLQMSTIFWEKRKKLLKHTVSFIHKPTTFLLRLQVMQH